MLANLTNQILSFCNQFGPVGSQIIELGIFVLAAFVVAIITRTFLQSHTKKLTGKTKTDIDDWIIHIITKPIFLAIILGGIHLGLRNLSFLSQYEFYVNGGFFIIYSLIGAWIVSKIVSLLITRGLKVKKKFERTPRLLNKVISAVIYVIAILMILGYFGVEITPLVAGLGIGGLAVGLALQSILSDFFAGLHIISDQPIRTDDYIEIEGSVSGYVEDIGWRSTRIKTLFGNIVIVPNNKLANSTLINYSMPEKEMSVVFQCGVAYDSDLKKVERVTIDVAKKIQKSVEGAVKDFEPFIRYHTFGDSNINFSIILRVKKFVDKYLLTHEFMKALKERYDKEGIEISWPVRLVYYGDKKE